MLLVDVACVSAAGFVSRLKSRLLRGLDGRDMSEADPQMLEVN